jgi:hypothetical protein
MLQKAGRGMYGFLQHAKYDMKKIFTLIDAFPFLQAPFERFLFYGRHTARYCSYTPGSVSKILFLQRACRWKHIAGISTDVTILFNMDTL